MTDIIIAQQPVNKELQAELLKATAAIDRKIKTLSGNSANYTFKAGAAFKYNELDSNTINIQTVVPQTNCNGTMGTQYLIKSLAKMKRVKQEYEETMKSLGVKSYPVCTWCAVNIDLWIEDLTVLVKKIVNSDTVTKLNAKRAELSQFLSAEEKLTNTLSDLKELMK